MNASVTQSFPRAPPLTLTHRRGKPLNFNVILKRTNGILIITHRKGLRAGKMAPWVKVLGEDLRTKL